MGRGCKSKEVSYYNCNKKGLLFKQLLKIFKKLVLVLVTSALVTETSKKDVVLDWVPCFHYLI